MTTHALGFSILTAPIASIDRRALSQAWYSALGFARDRPACSPMKRHPTVTARGRIAARATQGDDGARVCSASPPRHGCASESRRVYRSACERRAPRSVLARRIERVFLQPARKTVRTTLAIDGRNGRVHLSLQEGAGGLRLVAVCPPGARAIVARALQEVRFALAARGIALQAAIGGSADDD